MPLDTAGGAEEGAATAFPCRGAGGAALRPAAPLLRRFEVAAAVALVFFFMDALEGLPGFTKTG